MAISMLVEWVDPNPTTDVDHIEVWRKTGAGGTYAQIGSDFALGIEAYTDTNNGSGLTQGQEYYYQVRAYNATGQYSSVEGNVTVSNALFYDDFTGTTIDTGKWSVTNPDSTEVEISQNGVLNLKSLDIAGTSTAYANYIHSSTALDATGVLVMRFDMTRTGGNVATFSYAFGAFGLAPTPSFDNGIFITRNNTSANAFLRIRESAAGNAVDTGQSSNNSWKIVKAADGNVSFYYWNGSAWTLTNGPIATGFTTGNLYASATMTAFQSPLGEGLTEYTFDNLYVTDADFSTLNP